MAHSQAIQGRHREDVGEEVEVDEAVEALDLGAAEASINVALSNHGMSSVTHSKNNSMEAVEGVGEIKSSDLVRIQIRIKVERNI